MPTDFDAARIISETIVRTAEIHAEIGSTNDRALELAAVLSAELPLLVIATRQRAGRGRGANRWWSETGGLTFSLAIDTLDYRLRAEVWPRISLTAGLAVCRVLESLSAENPDAPRDARLKWPNDVLIGGRKICGILIESVQGYPGRFVIGIGLNVNNSLDSAPDEVRARATSLVDLSRRNHDLNNVLIAILQELHGGLEQLAANPARLTDEWSKRCVLTGKTVEIESGMRRLRGECQGLAEDGALLLKTAAGIERITSGVIVGWE